MSFFILTIDKVVNDMIELFWISHWNIMQAFSIGLGTIT
jgi:hypothetical protein